MIRFYLLHLALVICWASLAQENLYHYKWIYLKSDSIVTTLDSLPYIPGSVSAMQDGVLIIESDDMHQITIKSIQKLDSVELKYKLMPKEFYTSHYHRSIGLYDSVKYYRKRAVHDNSSWTPLRQESIAKSSSLHKSGSLTRGIAFGNTQNMGMTSTLNLTLDGKLSDDLHIRAIITDQNIPFQPEGNTENIQNLDQVFVELSAKQFSLQAGDLLLGSTSHAYFLNYRRSLQGLQLNTYHSVRGGSIENSVLVGLQKGRFTSVNVPVADGVAGPYRIPGPDNERFVIILANSERVFLDGVQLQRGFNHDYTIDYNLGEITFTNKIILTRYSRVRVEYEFTNLQYQRAVTATRTTYKYANHSELTINWYRERDNAFRSQFLDINDELFSAFSLAGDKPEGIPMLRIDSIGFQSNSILYKKVNKFLNGQQIEIYEYSTNPDSAYYRISFSYLGLGKGNYVQKQATVNGMVFQWVPPINGQAQGDYDPVVLLHSPAEQQLFSISNVTGINNYEKLSIEYATSLHDQNTLSTLDAYNNRGHALRFGLSSEDRDFTLINNYKLKAFVNTELNSSYFKGIDRFRAVEFERDWNIEPTLLLMESSQVMVNTGFSLEGEKNERLAYQLGWRNKTGAFDGMQHQFMINQNFGRFRLQGTAFHLNTSQLNDMSTTWSRIDAEFSYQAPHFVPGYRYRVDNNLMRYALTDSLAGSWMNFEEHNLFIRNGKQSPWIFELTHSIRDDKVPYDGELLPATLANTTTLSIGTKPANQKSFLMGLVYRHLDQFDQQGNNIPEAVLSGRMDWKHHFAKRHVRFDLNYTLSNSRELRREFTFIQVPTGQGTHTWRDENGDGVQDLDEFYEAINFDERNFIRVLLPGMEYFPAYESSINYRMHAEMSKAWKQADGFKKVLSAFTNLTTWQSTAKTINNDPTERAMAFAYHDNEHLLSGRKLLRNTTYFNRAHPVYGAEFNMASFGNRRLIGAGYEADHTVSKQVISRVNLQSQYLLQVKLEQVHKEVDSDFLHAKNYNIDQLQVSPALSWQPNNFMRITGRYAYAEKEGTAFTDLNHKAVHEEWATELNWNKSLEANFQCNLRWIKIEYDGPMNNALAYELLNALQPGNNIAWSINYLRKISKGMQMSLNYDGRKGQQMNTVHIGRIMMTALF